MSLDGRYFRSLIAAATVGIAASTAAAACPDHLQFLQAKCPQWQAALLPDSLPAARGNAFADSEAAAALGMKVFYDNRFSQAGSGVACANCHDPEHAFAENKRRSRTLREVPRNAPDLINAAWYRQAHFWDGKVDNLWSAPLFTFEQEDEMGSTRLHVVHTLASIYRIRYERIFGPMPDLSDTARFPEAGKPGMPEYDAMSPEDKDVVNQVYANLGKALEAYLRKLAAGRSSFDDFLNGSTGSMTAEARRGMLAFTRYRCDSCHSGPTFTDEGYHDLGFADNAGQAPDPARAGGRAAAAKWTFTSASRFADAAGDGMALQASRIVEDPRGFRTPSLRNVAATYPYGHNGAFETLEQVISAHARVLPGRAAPSAQDSRDLVMFLRSLSGSPPRAPWNYWPGG